MKFLRIRSLEKHQHYKDRRPPWIKLHAEVLDDYAFSCLQDASKAHLMLLWVVASQCDNRIPYDLAWITRKLGAQSPVDVEELIVQGFIEVFDDASVTLARRKQSAMTETETETEGEKRQNPRKQPRGDDAGFSLAPYLDAHASQFPGSSIASPARYGKVFKRLEAKHGAAEVLRRWVVCLAVKRTFATPEELSNHWSEYDVISKPKDPFAHLPGYPDIVRDGQLTEYGERATRPAGLKGNPYA